MEDPNPDPPVSGAYVRTLVKHLKTNPNSCSSSSSCSSSKMGENEKPPPTQHQHHKKQVRRRLHTSRPYQERLLNMAEARREIVTALKYHRAAMKKAADQTAPPEAGPPARPSKIPKSSPSSTHTNLIHPHANFGYNNNNNVNLRNLCYPSSMMNSYPRTWAMNSEPVEESNLDIVLPEQTLGLNLNYHDFNINLEASVFSNGSVSGSSSSSPSPSMATDQDQEGLNSSVGVGGGREMHVAVGEEEMAEIRSIGEKHSVEWSDKMSFVKSAWWLRFMKNEEGFEFGDPFDQILEFPDWMNNGKDRCFEQQLFADYHFFPDDHPSALPCMDIGEFEGMDGEWLA